MPQQTSCKPCFIVNQFANLEEPLDKKHIEFQKNEWQQQQTAGSVDYQERYATLHKISRPELGIWDENSQIHELHVGGGG
jgi:hypothetical protein